MNVFRNQVTEKRENRKFGKVVITSPSIYIWFERLLIAVILLILLVSSTLKFNRVTTINGYLKPSNGAAAVYSDVAGRVSDVHARNGDFVAKDDAVLSVENFKEFLSNGIRSSFDNRSDEQKMKLINEQIDQLSKQRVMKIDEMQLRRDAIKSEMQGIENLISLEAERFELTKLELAANQSLLKQNIISQVNFTKVQQYSLSVKARIAQLKNNYSSLEYKLRLLDYQEMSEESGINKEITTLEKRLLDIQATMANKLKELSPLVTAPISGIVTGLRIQEGQALTKNQLVFSILPVDAVYEAEIFLPMNLSAKIAMDQTIKVRVNALLRISESHPSYLQFLPSSTK